MEGTKTRIPEPSSTTLLSTPDSWGDGIYKYSVAVEVEDEDETGTKTWRALRMWPIPEKNGSEGERVGDTISIGCYLASEHGKIYQGTVCQIRIDGHEKGVWVTPLDHVIPDVVDKIVHEGQNSSYIDVHWYFQPPRLDDEVYTRLDDKQRSDLGTIKVDFVRRQYVWTEKVRVPNPWAHGTYSSELKNSLGSLTEFREVHPPVAPKSFTFRDHPGDKTRPHCSMILLPRPIETLRKNVLCDWIGQVRTRYFLVIAWLSPSPQSVGAPDGPAPEVIEVTDSPPNSSPSSLGPSEPDPSHADDYEVGDVVPENSVVHPDPSVDDEDSSDEDQVKEFRAKLEAMEKEMTEMKKMKESLERRKKRKNDGEGGSSKRAKIADAPVERSDEP